MAEPRRRGKADPLKKLRKAALKTIREKSEQIADKLLELTLEGNITCAKFLVALIENAPPTPESESRPFHSLVEEFAGEPEWVDPLRVNPLNDPYNPPSWPQIETYPANAAPYLEKSEIERRDTGVSFSAHLPGALH